MEIVQRNVENDSYICSVICNKTLVNVFMDDAGQQYFFQYVDKETGKLEERCCGCYQDDYLEQIEHELDYESWFQKQSEGYQNMIIEGRKRMESLKIDGGV